MRPYLRFLLPLLGFAAIAGVLGVGLTLNPSEVPSPLIGKPAPAFSAPALLEPERRISRADVVGEVALVNVWASWCAACRDEHPLLMQLAAEGTVPIYGLNYKDTREEAMAWLEELGNSYEAIIFDPKGRIGLDWGVYGVPETFVLDRQGIIRHKIIGALTPQRLDRELRPWLERLKAEPAPSSSEPRQDR